MIQTSITFRNDNPNTIWNKLAVKLGRNPTNDEAKAEVKRILNEVTIDMAGKGKLTYQRKRQN